MTRTPRVDSTRSRRAASADSVRPTRPKRSRRRRRSETDVPASWRPSPAQYRYLLALEDAVLRRLPLSDTAICRALKMSRQTLHEWRLEDAFNRWVDETLEKTSHRLWPLIVRRQELNALTGSIKAAEFVARVRNVGGFGRGNALGEGDPERLIDARTQYAVNILVQRPDDVASSVTLRPDDPRLLKEQG